MIVDVLKMAVQCFYHQRCIGNKQLCGFFWDFWTLVTIFDGNGCKTATFQNILIKIFTQDNNAGFFAVTQSFTPHK